MAAFSFSIDATDAPAKNYSGKIYSYGVESTCVEPAFPHELKLLEDYFFRFLQLLFPKPFPWKILERVKHFLPSFRKPWYFREPGWFNPKPNFQEE